MAGERPQDGYESARSDEHQVMFIDVEEERPAANSWRVVGVSVLLVGLGIAAVIFSDIAGGDLGGQVGPKVEVARDGSCVWSGREVSAGLVDIEFVNNSGEAVWVKFAPIMEGATIDDVLAVAPVTGDLHDYESVPLLVERGQNTRPVEPGETTGFRVGLTIPGDYVVSCSMTEPTFTAGVPAIASVPLHVVGD